MTKSPKVSNSSNRYHSVIQIIYTDDFLAIQIQPQGLQRKFLLAVISSVSHPEHGLSFLPIVMIFLLELYSKINSCLHTPLSAMPLWPRHLVLQIHSKHNFHEESIIGPETGDDLIASRH